METLTIDLKKKKSFEIGQQGDHNALCIHFINMKNVGTNKKYIYYTIDGIENCVPLTNDRFIIGYPLTAHSGIASAQLISKLNDNSIIKLSNVFAMHIKESKGYKDSGEYPVDPNIQSSYDLLDDLIDQTQDLINNYNYATLMEKLTQASSEATISATTAKECADELKNSTDFINTLDEKVAAQDSKIEKIEASTSHITTKQNTKIAALQTRMSEFTSLKDGSTTGDAELIDARIGADGTKYASTGDAMRGQVEQLTDALVDLNNELLDIPLYHIGNVHKFKTIVATDVIGTSSYDSNNNLFSYNYNGSDTNYKGVFIRFTHFSNYGKYSFNALIQNTDDNVFLLNVKGKRGEITIESDIELKGNINIEFDSNRLNEICDIGDTVSLRILTKSTNVTINATNVNFYYTSGEKLEKRIYDVENRISDEEVYLRTLNYQVVWNGNINKYDAVPSAIYLDGSIHNASKTSATNFIKVNEGEYYYSYLSDDEKNAINALPNGFSKIVSFYDSNLSLLSNILITADKDNLNAKNYIGDVPFKIPPKCAYIRMNFLTEFINKTLIFKSESSVNKSYIEKIANKLISEGDEIDGNVIFYDDFNNDTLSNVWVKEVGVVRNKDIEKQYYKKENVSISDSCLILTAKKENYEGGYSWTSGSVNTANNLTLSNGCEILTKIKFDGLYGGAWPALWLVGEKYTPDSSETTWPNHGEIDIFEIWMNDISRKATVQSTIHYANENNEHTSKCVNLPGGYPLSDAVYIDKLYDGTWHNVKMKWENEYIDIYMDGINVAKFNINENLYYQNYNPFSKGYNRMKLIINFAIDERYYASGSSDQKMYVDYVKVSTKNKIKQPYLVFNQKEINCNVGDTILIYPNSDKSFGDKTCKVIYDENFIQPTQKTNEYGYTPSGNAKYTALKPGTTYVKVTDKYGNEDTCKIVIS